MAKVISEVPKDLLPLIRRDPRLGASLCRERIAQDYAHYRKNLRNRIAEAYLISTEMRANYALWKEFLEDPFFNDDSQVRSLTKANFRSAVLQSVMYYLFDAGMTDASKRNRVWKYARAVEGYLEHDVPAEEVANKIEQDNGIEALCRKAAKENPKQSPQQDWLQLISQDVPDLGPKSRKTVILEVDDEEYEYLRKCKIGVMHDARLRTAERNEDGVPVLNISQIGEVGFLTSEYHHAMRDWDENEED